MKHKALSKVLKEMEENVTKEKIGGWMITCEVKNQHCIDICKTSL